MNSAVELAGLAAEEEAKAAEEKAEAERLHERRHSSCVIGAVVCSAAFLECTINGLYADAKSPVRRTKLHNALCSVWSEPFERLPILAKYQLALTLARRDIFQTGDEPYQSAEAVIDLLNTIAHPKEILGSYKNQRRLETRLNGRYKFGAQREHRKEFFPGRCLTADCAVWAARSVIRFVTEFKRRLPPTAYFFGAQDGTARSMLARLAELEEPGPL